MKVNPLHFYEDTWGENIYVLNGATPKETEKFARRQLNDKNYSNRNEFAGRCLNVSGEGTVIALRRPFLGGPSEHGTLAHECFHAAEYILGNRGMKHTTKTSEPYAYLMGSLVCRILGLLKKQKRGKPKRP